MSRSASQGPPRPRSHAASFVSGGRFDTPALAELILGARGVRQGESLWIDLTRSRELESAVVVGLAHWVLRIRGHQVHVFGLTEQRGDHWVARRSRARA